MLHGDVNVSAAAWGGSIGGHCRDTGLGRDGGPNSGSGGSGGLLPEPFRLRLRREGPGEGVVPGRGAQGASATDAQRGGGR